MKFGINTNFYWRIIENLLHYWVLWELLQLQLENTTESDSTEHHQKQSPLHPRYLSYLVSVEGTQHYQGSQSSITFLPATI